MFIDLIVVSPICAVFHGPNNEDAALWVVGVLYETVLLSQWGGRNLGKKIMGIRVVTEGEGQMDWVKAFVRSAGKTLSAVALFIGFLWMLRNEKKQTWHDIIADTFVVEG